MNIYTYIHKGQRKTTQKKEVKGGRERTIKPNTEFRSKTNEIKNKIQICNQPITPRSKKIPPVFFTKIRNCIHKTETLVISNLNAGIDVCVRNLIVEIETNH